MSLVELILICVLQFEAGISGGPTDLYHRPGDVVILPCGSSSSSPSTCSIVSWLHSRNISKTLTDVKNGKVKKCSARAGRLSLDTDCSLVINSITAEDVGLFTCRQGGVIDHDVYIHLSVLTISSSPPHADAEVTLECSLLRYSHDPPCQQSSISWLNELGSVLPGEGVGYELPGQINCVSRLTVKRQSGNSRRYTCQFVNQGNHVVIQGDYTPVFTDHFLDRTYIIISAVVGVVLVLVVIAAVLIKCRKRAKVTEDVQKPTKHPEEPESSLTYVTVSHANQKVSPNKKLKEEVTYSAVKTPVKSEADDGPSSLYSCVK